MLIHLLLASVKAYCPEPNSFCVTMKVVNSKNCYTVHSKYDGWTGFGIGSTQMKGADMYIGWRNTSNGVTIVNANAPGHVSPSIQGLVPSVPLLEQPPSFSKLSFSFCRTPLDTKNHIYAGESKTPQGNIDTRSVTLSFHTGIYGSFVSDLLTELGAGGGNGAILQPSGSLRDIYTIHGILMFIAWCVCPFFGIFIAKHFKSKLGHNWFRLHVLFMGVGTGLLSLIAFILVTFYQPPPHFGGSTSLEQGHTVLGLIITILMIAQVILGIVIDRLFDEKRESIPMRDKMHWYLGRLLSVFAIANSYMGLSLFDGMYSVSIGIKVGFWIIVVLGFLMLAYGESSLTSEHHVKEAASQDALIH